MKIDFNEDSPIYVQISQSVEDGILNGVFEEENPIPSTTEISLMYKINPATVNKGFNILVNKELIYKKRGIGMFVKKGSYEILKEQRREQFFNGFIVPIIEEAKKLNISEDEIIKMIQKER
ncbi:MAG: GntR family transcriptional regulator [Clostridium sp.]